MPRRTLALAALLTILAVTDAALADAPTTRPMPVRIVTVNGEATAKFPHLVEPERKKADLASYEAALNDAKDRATRAAKVLGVSLGAPITVETITATSDNEGNAMDTFLTNVKVVFELREP